MENELPHSVQLPDPGLEPLGEFDPNGPSDLTRLKTM
jgi:hypothetical protein